MQSVKDKKLGERVTELHAMCTFCLLREVNSALHIERIQTVL